MALTISQIVSVSYPAVLAENGKASNQWSQNSLLQTMEAKGMIKRVGMGPTIEHPLDYQSNPGTDFLATDLTTTSLTKTEVLTAASYEPGQLSVPIVWSKGDEAKNSSDTQKISFVKALLENAMQSHDDAIERALFTTSTDGFIGLQNILPDNGIGSPGGIDAATEAWWRNYSATYASAGTNMEAQMTKSWNTAAKGTGGKNPDLIVSGGDAQAIYEGTLQVYQRFIDVKKADGGFKSLAFKTADYIFSQYGGTRVYFLQSKCFMLNVSKDAYKQMGDTIEIPNANGYVRKLYSMLQFTTNNKSRGAILTQV